MTEARPMGSRSFTYIAVHLLIELRDVLRDQFNSLRGRERVVGSNSSLKGFPLNAE